jgi:urocanate hydratase
MTDKDYTESRTITEWVRPNGGKKPMSVPMTKDAASVLDSAVKAGYTYSIEWLGNSSYAFYISDDSIEMDIVTDIIKGETSAQQRGALSRSITRNPVDVLDRKKQQLIDMLAAEDE